MMAACYTAVKHKLELIIGSLEKPVVFKFSVFEKVLIRLSTQYAKTGD